MNFLFEKFLKKSKNGKEKLAAKKPDQDFIPYVCHYDPNTILTKNGELLQIIRVTGFHNSSATSEIISLRDVVRSAIGEYVKDGNFAFWFSTLRRKKNILPEGEFSDLFAAKINQAWDEENDWQNQYVNELYITVIIEGLDTSIKNFQAFMRTFSYSATKSLNKEFLQNAHNQLSDVVGNILESLKDYGGKLLGLYEKNDVIYSEPMRFFGKIVNLYEEYYPVSANDIADDLASHKLFFGNRELEVVGYNNKNFASMMSLKEYQEIPVDLLDGVLQLPFEFIITQSFDFSFSKKELEIYEYQDHIFDISGDVEMRQITGSDGFMEERDNEITGYGKLQTTIMLISNNQEELEKDINNLLERFYSIGLALVREDVFLEHCFWSQLPGNFFFLRRQKIIDRRHIAGFASLHNFPAGLIYGKWGGAVTVLRTVLDTPYFFNFYHGSLCHSIIVGSKENGRHHFLNFILAQSQKFQPKIFYFNFDSSLKFFIKGFPYTYHKLGLDDKDDAEFLTLNPFSLPQNAAQRTFLIDFIKSLVIFSKDPIAQNELDLIPEAIDRIFASNVKNFKSATEIFNTPKTARIYQKLKIWNGEKLGHIFGADIEKKSSSMMTAFDCSLIANQKPILIPIVNYLLHKIESSLDGKPTIIVLDEAWQLLDNVVMAPKFRDILLRLKEQNAVVILTAANAKELSHSSLFSDISKNIASNIYMPDRDCELYEETFSLAPEEIDVIKAMEVKDNNFLLKSGDDAVVGSLKFNKRPEVAKLLAPDEETIFVVKEVIEYSKSDDPQKWLPHAFDTLQELIAEKAEAEKNAAKEAKRRKKR